MLTILKNWFNRRRLNSYAKERGIEFNGYGGLVINHLVVSEFGYLLRYYSGGALESFDDFEKVFAISASVRSAVDADYLNPKLREEQNLQVSRSTADRNLQNLKGILDAIDGYVAKCKQLGISV